MKKLFLATAAALVALATPATAQAAQPYVEAVASTSKYRELPSGNVDFRNDVTYGARAGIDFGAMTADVGVENFLNGSDNLTVNGNLGLDLPLGRNSPLALYGQAGVLSTAGDLGYRLGGGVKLGLVRNLYVRAGVQRDDYGSGASVAGTAAVGVRF